MRRALATFLPVLSLVLACTKHPGPTLAPVVAASSATPAPLAVPLASSPVPVAPDPVPIDSPNPLLRNLPPLETASIVAIYDSWNGLGKTHTTFIRLERNATGFRFRAKVAGAGTQIGEIAADPFIHQDPGVVPCLCAVNAHCECESDPSDIVEKSGQIAAASVEQFLREIKRHGLDPDSTSKGRHWTDDYPKAHVMVWFPKGAPMHLSFVDQQRRWLLAGRPLSPDPTPATTQDGEEEQRISHPRINAAYGTLLDNIGLRRWVDELAAHGRGGGF